MSESTVGAGDVTEPPAEDEIGQERPAEDEIGQERPAEDEIGQERPAEDEIEQEPLAEDETAEQKPSEIVDKELKRQDEETERAREVAEGAGSTYKDQKGRSEALSNLKKDIDQAVLVYASVRDQLKIDQQAYLDYQESEKESLEKLLGPEAAAEVKKKSEDKRLADDKAVVGVESKRKELAAAEKERDDSDKSRKGKATEVAEWKQLAATIGARHAKLKSMRDEITKAHQAGHYALAYWLLELRDYDKELKVGAAALIMPDEMPAVLLAAVKSLADAEKDYAAKESTVGKRRNELAEAEKQLADRKAQGEARLRDELKQMAPAQA